MNKEKPFDLVRQILRSEQFHANDLEEKTKILEEIIKTGEITKEDLILIINQINEEKEEEKTVDKTLESLDYNSFLNVVKRGEITGKDLLSLCGTSKKLNEYCNRSFQLTDSKGDKVGEPIPYYLFVSFLTDHGIKVFPWQNAKEIFKQKIIGGRVWSVGSNKHGVLGLGDNKNRTLPELIPTLKNIVQISSGNDHSLCLDNQGRVWSFGNGAYGRLGLGYTPNKNIPTLIPTFGDVFKNIIKISAKGAHSLCLDNQGRVWSFGSNVFGQLGLGVNYNTAAPELIPTLKNIVGISAGVTYSLCLDDQGRVYSFGDNNFGQLGLSVNHTSIPILIPDLNNIVKISCDDFTSFCLDNLGQVWIFGESIFENIRNHVSIPRVLPDLQNIIDIYLEGNRQIFVNDQGVLFQLDTLGKIIPVVRSENGLHLFGLTGVFQISKGIGFTLFLK